MNLSGEWYYDAHNLELAVDLLGFLILFLLIFLFNLSKQALAKTPSRRPHFIALYFVKENRECNAFCGTEYYVNRYFWEMGFRCTSTNKTSQRSIALSSISFLRLLILADVVILLISFRYTEEYSKLIRNTGFIIATILIRLSFSADGYLSMILILNWREFALLILKSYNAMEHPKTRFHCLARRYSLRASQWSWALLLQELE